MRAGHGAQELGRPPSLLRSLSLFLHAAAALSMGPSGVPSWQSRRAVLAAVPTLALFRPPAALAHEEEQENSELPPPPPTTIDYSELVTQLKGCRASGVCSVERVDFLSASGDSAVAYIRGAERVVLNLPVDDPTNDSSPLRLVAQCRDAGVPFTFSSIQAALKATKSSSVLSNPSGGLTLPSLPSLPKLF